MKRIIMNTPKLVMAACIAMLPLGGIADAQAEMPKRPNILFIHVDQLHWQAISAYGNPHVKTPAMDRIAADGISFRASYAADLVCCAARASWFTGRMSSEHGQASNGPYPVLKELPDLGGWLREHGGYETVCGKHGGDFLLRPRRHAWFPWQGEQVGSRRVFLACSDDCRHTRAPPQKPDR